VFDLLERWLKNGIFEVQEYVRLQAATIRGATSPPFYYRDIIIQLDAIGVGSLTVVLLTGFFTEPCSRCSRASRSISSARGRSSGVSSARRC
jgi:phospholipid/cholesterol/gamma-HCH transport system permease protein